jgi:hypothetical protein
MGWQHKEIPDPIRLDERRPALAAGTRRVEK